MYSTLDMIRIMQKTTSSTKQIPNTLYCIKCNNW